MKQATRCALKPKPRFPEFQFADHFPDIRKMVESHTVKPIEFERFGIIETIEVIP